MFRSDRALDVVGRSQADAFADRFTFARASQDGSAIYMHTRESTLSDFFNGICKILLALSVFGLVLLGCVYALNHLDLKAEASSASGTSQRAAVSEIGQLRSEIADLTSQNMEMRTELALLTGRDGVLPKLVGRLQEQRRVNAAHSNAIRQLYSTTGLIGASLPSFDEPTVKSEEGRRPVQVTPVAAAQEDAPKRVVVTPEPGAEPAETGIAKDGN